MVFGGESNTADQDDPMNIVPESDETFRGRAWLWSGKRGI